jgi:hypothetical protein
MADETKSVVSVNGTAIFTRSGAAAQMFTDTVQVGMVGSIFRC